MAHRKRQAVADPAAWCVTTKYFDSGSCKFNVFPVYDILAEAELLGEDPPAPGSMLKGGRVNNLCCEEYRHYFKTYEEAYHWGKVNQEQAERIKNDTHWHECWDDVLRNEEKF